MQPGSLKSHCGAHGVTCCLSLLCSTAQWPHYQLDGPAFTHTSSPSLAHCLLKTSSETTRWPFPRTFRPQPHIRRRTLQVPSPAQINSKTQTPQAHESAHKAVVHQTRVHFAEQYPPSQRSCLVKRHVLGLSGTSTVRTCWRRRCGKLTLNFRRVSRLSKMRRSLSQIDWMACHAYSGGTWTRDLDGYQIIQGKSRPRGHHSSEDTIIMLSCTTVVLEYTHAIKLQRYASCHQEIRR